MVFKRFITGEGCPVTIALALALPAFASPVSAQVETGAVARPIPAEPVSVPAEKDSKLSSRADLEEDQIRRIEKLPIREVIKDPSKPLPASELETKKTSSSASLDTRNEARTFTLQVPAPRGQILDRKGRPLAQNKVAYYAAINFPQLENATETEILQYAGQSIVQVNQKLGANWDLPAKTVLEHYRNRRWLPLLFSDPLSEEDLADLQGEDIKGLMFQPVYLRHYPRGAFLSHVIGYVGKRPPLSTGPIGRDEPLWGEGVGAEGLEEQFDVYLRGEPGKVNMLFEADGTRVKEDTIRHPQPGQNLVTTIDAEMQELAEELLAEKTKRGAFVVMHVRTGDILVLASWPQYNPNDFIPRISTERFDALRDDPEKPMFPRAYRGSYPPASTFKIAVALAALENRVIHEQSLISCPTEWNVGGDVFMSNWNEDPEGDMNVIGALARSCNTWFYQVGLMTGTDGVTGMARRLGLGEKTGIPLKAEAEGFVPTDRWYYKKNGYFMPDGELANICIGQGQVEASPLQIARMMAAVGNRHYVVKPRLVKQVQDFNHNIVTTFPVERRSDLDIDPYYLDVVRQGMEEVVNSGRGTGQSAGNPFIVMCGKTGTAQWKATLEQNLAWFAGFAPAENPVYAFAVIYEGNPGEKVGGGKNAAPILGEFFKQYLDDEEHLAEIKAEAKEVGIELAKLEPVRARPVVESIYNGAAGEEEMEQPEPTADERKSDGPLSRWFRRFRGR